MSNITEALNDSYGHVCSVMKDEVVSMKATMDQSIKNHGFFSSAYNGFRQLSLPLKAVFGVAVAGGAYYATQYGITDTAVQALGLTGLAVKYRATQFKDHHHVIATGSIGSGILIAQQLALGSVSNDMSAYLPGIALLGQAIMCATPKMNQKIRTGIGLCGSLIGGAIALGAAYNGNGGILSYIPGAIATLAPVVTTIPKDQVARARLSYVGFNTAMASYWLTQPAISWGAVAVEAILLRGHSKTLVNEDIPYANKDTNTKLPIAERLSTYFSKVLVGGQKTETIAMSKNDFKKHKEPSPK